MKTNEYRIMSEAVERGVTMGWHDGWKYMELPEDLRMILYRHEDYIKEQLERCVMNEITSYFELDTGVV